MTDPNTVIVLLLLIVMAYVINDTLTILRGILMSLLERLNKLEKENEKRS